MPFLCIPLCHFMLKLYVYFLNDIDLITLLIFFHALTLRYTFFLSFEVYQSTQQIEDWRKEFQVDVKNIFTQ